MPTDFYDLRAAVVARIGGEPVLGWLGVDCAEFRAAVRREALRRGCSSSRSPL